MRTRFTDLNERELNRLNYHEADLLGHNDEAYEYFMKEYEQDHKDLFNNTAAMVMAMMYRHNGDEALEYFSAIPADSIETTGCSYCVERISVAMWAALDAGDIKLADALAPKMYKALHIRKDFGILVMYHAWKNDTTLINQLIHDARNHPNYELEWEYLNYLAGRLFLVRGEPEIASRYFKKGIERYKGTKERMLSKCYYFDNQLDMALSSLEAFIKENPDSYIARVELGMIYARQGKADKAVGVIEELESKIGPFNYGEAEYHQARIYALLGEKEKAIDLIGKAIARGFKYDLWVTFDHDPDIMSLKDHPEYIRLMSQFDD